MSEASPSELRSDFAIGNIGAFVGLGPFLSVKGRFWGRANSDDILEADDVPLGDVMVMVKLGRYECRTEKHWHHKPALCPCRS